MGRGTSAEDLYQQFQDSEQGKALARGKDYCKPFVHLVCVRGRMLTVDQKRDKNHHDNASSSEEDKPELKRHKPSDLEKEKAAIEAKYCARVPAQGSVPD